MPEGGKGIVALASLQADGVYLHVRLNHNLSAEEQTAGHGKIGIIVNIHNRDSAFLPGGVGTCLEQAMLTELFLTGDVAYHAPYSLKFFQVTENGGDAKTKYTTVWEFFMPNAELASVNGGVFAQAFEETSGAVTLKSGYNVMMNIIGNMTKDAAGSDRWEGGSNCDEKDGTWYYWYNGGYGDWASDQKAMILYENGFCTSFERFSDTLSVNVVKNANAVFRGLPETVTLGDSLEISVTPTAGYIIHKVKVNGKEFAVTRENGVYSCSVNISDLDLKWFETVLNIEAIAVKEVDIEISVSATDLSGGGLGAEALNGKTVILTGEVGSFNLTISDGKIRGTVYADTYSVFLYGFKTTQILVTDTGAAESGIAFEATIGYVTQGSAAVDNGAGTLTITGNGGDDWVNSAWAGIAEPVVGQAVNNANNFQLEFTVRNVTDTNAGWPTDAWAGTRFAVQIMEGHCGIYFFVPNGEANIFKMASANLVDESGGKITSSAAGSDYAWFEALLCGQDGIKLKVVRLGATVTLNAYNGSEWVKLGGAVYGDENAETVIRFFGASETWEFSDISASALAYTPYTPPTADDVGFRENWSDGTNYFNADGSVMTGNAVIPVIAKLDSVTITITGHKDGDSAVALSGELTALGEYEKTASGTVEAGKLTLTDVYAIKYSLTLGDYSGEIVFQKGQTEYTVVLEYEYAEVINRGGDVDLSAANEASHRITFSGKFGEWADYDDAAIELKLKLDPEIANSRNVEFSATLSAKQLGFWASRRFGIQLAEGYRGIFFFLPENEAHIYGMTSRYLKDESAGSVGRADWIWNLINNGGLQIKVVRAEDIITLHAYNGSEWLSIGSVACPETAVTEIRLLANGAIWQLSDIAVKSLTQAAPLRLTSETGNYARLTDGTEHDTADGSAATPEALTIPKRKTNWHPAAE